MQCVAFIMTLLCLKVILRPFLPLRLLTGHRFPSCVLLYRVHDQTSGRPLTFITKFDLFSSLAANMDWFGLNCQMKSENPLHYFRCTMRHMRMRATASAAAAVWSAKTPTNFPSRVLQYYVREWRTDWWFSRNAEEWHCFLHFCPCMDRWPYIVTSFIGFNTGNGEKLNSSGFTQLTSCTGWLRRKWRETKLQPSRARPAVLLGCS